MTGKRLEAEGSLCPEPGMVSGLRLRREANALLPLTFNPCLKGTLLMP